MGKELGRWAWPVVSSGQLEEGDAMQTIFFIFLRFLIGLTCGALSRSKIYAHCEQLTKMSWSFVIET
jgi:hypothetical protein